MFGFDAFTVAFIAMAALVGWSVVKAIHAAILARNERRAAVRTIGTRLATLGVPEKFTDPLFAYSDGDYPELLGHIRRIKKELTGDPKLVLEALRSIVTGMAKDPDGLAVLQEVLADAQETAAKAAA